MTASPAKAAAPAAAAAAGAGQGKRVRVHWGCTDSAGVWLLQLVRPLQLPLPLHRLLQRPTRTPADPSRRMMTWTRSTRPATAWSRRSGASKRYPVDTISTEYIPCRRYGKLTEAFKAEYGVEPAFFVRAPGYVRAGPPVATHTHTLRSL